MISIIFITAFMAGLSGGTFGAGGNVGKVISRLISNVGNSGNSGGGGSKGILGISRSTANHLGTGKSGSCTNCTLLGTNLNFGIIIFSHTLISDKSMKISGK